MSVKSIIINFSFVGKINYSLFSSYFNKSHLKVNKSSSEKSSI